MNSTASQRNATECCPSNRCLYIHRYDFNIPDCRIFTTKKIEFPINVTGALIPKSRNYTDPSTSFWITRYDPAGWNVTQHGLNSDGEEVHRLGFGGAIGFGISMVFFVLLVVIAVGSFFSKKKQRQAEEREQAERIRNFSRSNTGMSGRSTGGSRFKWPSWTATPTVSTSQSPNLPTHSENVEMGSVPSTTNQYPGLMPLQREEDRLWNAHLRAEASSLAAERSVEEGGPCRGNPGHFPADPVDDRSHFSDRPIVAAHAPSGPPRYEQFMAQADQERRASESEGSIASFEGRPRTPPPIYANCGRDQLVNREGRPVPGTGAGFGAGSWGMPSMGVGSGVGRGGGGGSDGGSGIGDSDLSSIRALHAFWDRGGTFDESGIPMP